MSRNRTPRIPVALIVAAFVTAIGAHSATTRDWIEPRVLAATQRMLSTMPDDFHAIRPVQAERQIATRAPVILDVREPAEFAVDHIAGARNVPLRQLGARLDDLPADRAAEILVYCRTGHRGAIALAVLRMFDYTNVRSIYGGREAWRLAGLPVVR